MNIFFLVSCKWGPWVDPGCPDDTCEPTTKILTRSIEQQAECGGLDCVLDESSKVESCPAVKTNGRAKIFTYN